MSRIWKLKPFVNKNNKQITLSIPKKELPLKLKKLINKDPSLVKKLKLKFEGFE